MSRIELGESVEIDSHQVMNGAKHDYPRSSKMSPASLTNRKVILDFDDAHQYPVNVILEHTIDAESVGI